MVRRATLLLLTVCWPGPFAAGDTAQVPLGARAMGLAGAFTAVADDATAHYWNPAGVAHGPFVRLGVYWEGSFEDRADFVDRLRSGEAGRGAFLFGDRAWGFSTGLTMLGVALTRYTYTRSRLDGDVVRSLGLKAWDMAATFVQSLPPDELTVGLNLRYIRGTAFSGAVAVSDIPEGEKNVADLVRSAVSDAGNLETEPGVDLGLLYQPKQWLRLGLVARNLNRPTFHTDHAGAKQAISLEPHARAGVAFMLPREVILALDVDVTSREEAAEAAGWREIAMGAEKSWKGGVLSLRSGLRSELSGKGWRRPGFSGGVGFRFRGILLDLAAMTGTRRRLGSLSVGVSFTR